MILSFRKISKVIVPVGTVYQGVNRSKGDGNILLGYVVSETSHDSQLLLRATKPRPSKAAGQH